MAVVTEEEAEREIMAKVATALLELAALDMARIAAGAGPDLARVDFIKEVGEAMTRRVARRTRTQENPDPT